MARLVTSQDRTQPTARRATPRFLAAGLALALLTGTAACGADDEDGDATQDTVETEIGDPASVESTTSQAETPDTTAPEAATTTAVPVGAPDPEAAAATLYTAWKANDPAAASTVAEPMAVEGMSTVAPGDYSLYNRCDTGEFGRSSCLYRGDPGTIQFAMVDRDGAWVVTTAMFSPA